MKTKVVQHVPRIIFNVFKVFEFSKFSGSQHLSDFQNFFGSTMPVSQQMYCISADCGKMHLFGPIMSVGHLMSHSTEIGKSALFYPTLPVGHHMYSQTDRLVQFLALLFQWSSICIGWQINTCGGLNGPLPFAGSL